MDPSVFTVSFSGTFSTGFLSGAIKQPEKKKHATSKLQLKYLLADIIRHSGFLLLSTRVDFNNRTEIDWRHSLLKTADRGACWRNG
jgi:hypothetical protein